MKIAIRKESNGLIYIDKTALTRFGEEELKQPPYNFKLVEVAKEDCEAGDFNDNLTFNETKYNARKTRETNATRIAELKQNLTATDYKAIKFAEGAITAEDYAETKAQRQAWRDEINSLEV